MLILAFVGSSLGFFSLEKVTQIQNLHSGLSSRRRRNALGLILVDGVSVEGMQPITILFLCILRLIFMRILLIGQVWITFSSGPSLMQKEVV